MSGQRVLLVEIKVTSPAGVVETLRFSDRAIPPMPPTDALRPNAGFDSRMLEPPALRRMLWDNIETLAPSLGVGDLALSNAGGDLDAYEGHAWGEIGVWLWTEGTPSAEARLVLKGLCGQPGYPRAGDQIGRVRVPLYGYEREASKPVQTTLYAGTNDGTILYEGTAEGLKGQPKPLAYGDLRAAHLPVPLVNAAEMAHQLHDGPISGTVTLFDRGDDAGLVADGDLVGAAFDAAAPVATHWVSDVGRGLIKFNGSPVGQFTAGCKGEAGPAGYVETTGPILARILARAGVPGHRIGASVSALAAPAVIGVYLAGEQTPLADALRFAAAGAPAAVLPDREGVWQASAWGPPAATADFEIGEYDVLNAASDEVGAPIGEIRIGWGRIWQTFDGSELAPALVGTDAQARLKESYRWAVAADPRAKSLYPDTWRTVTIETPLRVEAAALDLAQRMLALLGLRDDGRPRRPWRLTVPIVVALGAQLGQTAAVSYPPQGLGGNYLLIGEEPLRPRRDQAILTVWG